MTCTFWVPNIMTTHLTRTQNEKQNYNRAIY